MSRTPGPPAPGKIAVDAGSLGRKDYERALKKLHVELVKLQGLEADRHGPEVVQPVVRLFARAGRDVRRHRYVDPHCPYKYVPAKF